MRDIVCGGRDATDALVITLLVVEDLIFPDNAEQVMLVEKDEVIETFPAERADHPLAVCVCVWSEEGCWNASNAHGIGLWVGKNRSGTEEERNKFFDN